MNIYAKLQILGQISCIKAQILGQGNKKMFYAGIFIEIRRKLVTIITVFSMFDKRNVSRLPTVF